MMKLWNGLWKEHAKKILTLLVFVGVMVAFVVPIPIDHEESPFIFILTRNWFLILFTLSGLLFLAALIHAVSRRAKAVRETKSVNEKEVKEDGGEKKEEATKSTVVASTKAAPTTQQKVPRKMPGWAKVLMVIVVFYVAMALGLIEFVVEAIDLKMDEFDRSNGASLFGAYPGWYWATGAIGIMFMLYRGYALESVAVLLALVILALFL